MLVDTASEPVEITTFTRQGEFINGVKDTFPMILGAIPFGIIFGASALNSGLTEVETLGMSMFVFAGSAQFIAVKLVTDGVGIGVIVLTTFIVNVRHALYSASLAPYMKHLSQKWLLPLGFWLTDESYAVVIRRYPVDDNSPYKHWYHLGSSVAMYINWLACTLIGIVAGRTLENLGELGLDFALVVTFIGIVVPLIVNRPMLACAVVSAITAVLANGLPHNLGLMLAALLGIVAGVMTQKNTPQKAD